MPQNRQCDLCGLASSAKSVCIWADGANSSLVFCVGQAPGADEDRLDKPFVGRAGQFLRNAIARAGLLPEEVVYSNVVKCRPPQNRPPTAEEMKACRPYLLEELETVKPKYVFAFGAEAISHFLGRKPSSVLNLQGKKLEIDGRWVFPMAHPSYVLRQGANNIEERMLPVEREFRRQLQTHVTWIRQQGKGISEEIIEGKPEVIICRTMEDINRALSELEGCERVAYDCETMGLFPF